MTGIASNPRPLVVRCGAFGDVVMITPLIRLLHARYGQPVDVVGSGGWTPPLLEHEPALGHLQMIRSRNTPYLLCPSQWALVRWLRARGRGPVYLCDTDAAIEGLLARAGLPEADIVRRLPADDHDADGRTRLWPDRWMHMGMRDPAQAYPTRADVDPAAHRLPVLTVTAADRADLAQWRQASGLGDCIVLFQPGNKRTHKRGRIATASHPKYWPPQAWAELAAAIWQARPQARIVLCGSPAERSVLEEIRQAAGGDARMFNGADALPVPRLLALLEVAHSLVSVDTGPAHAAAALGCPLVVLFGPASPALWRPIGPGTVIALGGEHEGHGRVRDIPVDSVISAWRQLADAPAS
ncbi:glycosyltransferase family 9 protein [Pseudoxanthomonas mexicana]|uniref:glycosyltransferase family 9 protein n=1 Tax=Pseudoxanthomonas mexicana TaxID=128785 RepID=UPI00398ABC17